jgi:hypothetical protein
MMSLIQTITLKNGRSAMYSILDLWLEKFDCIAGKKNRKVNCFALVKFIPMKDFDFLSKVGLILNILVGVVQELGEDSGFISNEAAGILTFEENRRLVQAGNDPMNSIKLVNELVLCLRMAESQHVEPSFEHILQGSMDPSILASLYGMIKYAQI